MSAKHTPGPWFADDSGVGGSHDRHGNWFGVGPQGDALGRGFDVALVEKQPDAHLIAAAPDLLAALESLVADADSDSWTEEDSHHRIVMASSVEHARAAIAKAKP